MDPTTRRDDLVLSERQIPEEWDIMVPKHNQICRCLADIQDSDDLTGRQRLDLQETVQKGQTIHINDSAVERGLLNLK